MSLSLHARAAHAKRLTSAALIASALVMTGCASTAATTAATATPVARTLPQVHATVVYVAAFDADATGVKVDGGMIGKLTTLASGSSSDEQRQQTALKTRAQLADALVRELRAQGIPALRADGPVPNDRDALVVQGRFDTIDAGNRRRRILIGLGAGRSEVGASVAVLFQPAHGAPQPLDAFSASANSGHLPGMVETAGVGAVAGRVATSAAVGAGLHGASEAKHDTVASDTDRLARSIAKQFAAKNTTHAWVPTTSAS
ncbi:DUF4410 domain-containing protein [Burkholderia cepacia]|uniref:DUF4410 domain-containing protein n=1 Tax=Burkholderia cepacia GG4 TaxID=1009846 RepID=A0A9W3K325_BURCE|nr:DUF4410 domain-containing protein [Burkholderia cepacia]AFQ50052.1 hypothetical protein GEM_3662 [Burkholderia cepacia GG4]